MAKKSTVSMSTTPKLGARVYLKDYAGPRLGTVMGHGTQYRATYAQPVVLVQMDHGGYLEGRGIFVSTLVCDPSNVVEVVES